MEINTGNYEVFIIDYLDGKLGTVETAQLLLFLENNPRLKEEFDDLKTMTVTPPLTESFGFNESLKQPFDADAINLTADNYQHYFIASVEGDLSSAGRDQINQFLNEHPELVSEYKLYNLTKLVPDIKVRYPEHKTLIVAPKRVYMRYYYTSAIAASMLLLITIWLRMTPGTDNKLNDTLRHSIEQQNTQEDSRDSKFENQDSKSSNSNPAPSNSESQIANPKSQISNPESQRRNPESQISNPKSQISTPKSQISKPKSTPVREIRKIEKRGMITNNTPLYSENSTRNFYSGIYNDIQLSQEMAMAENENIQTPVKEVKNEKRGTVKAARVLGSVISTGEQLAEQIPESLNGWLFADMGLKGFNLLTNNNYEIDRKLNNKGKIESFKITKTEENL